MKVCISCSENKDDNEFKDYTRKRCICCYNTWRREYDNKNRESIRNRQRIYQAENQNILRQKRKKYAQDNVQSIKDTQRRFKENNPNYFTLYDRERYNSDILYRLKRNLRNLIKSGFAKKNINKSPKSEEILGCTFEEFKHYLESKFEDWMAWDNRGLYNGELNYGWDIDHIIPLSLAKNESELISLNHFSNLQPLCSKINRDIKRNK